LCYGPQFNEEADEDEDNNPISIIAEFGRRVKTRLSSSRGREERESYIKRGNEV
jgi:hypothetical protein